jgi:hypothetical protein
MSEEPKHYPHQISLLLEKGCEVCKNNQKDIQILGVSGCPFIGFQTCSDLGCIDQAHKWLETTCIPHDTLVQEFGSWVYVQRSNKRLEHGWIIRGDAYQSKPDGPFWVTVRNIKRHLTKVVTLDKLRHWNIHKLHQPPQSKERQRPTNPS